MAVSKPTIIDKTPKLTKFNNGGKRFQTTKIIWHYTGKAEAKAINTINNWFNAITNGYKVNGKYLYASSKMVIPKASSCTLADLNTLYALNLPWGLLRIVTSGTALFSSVSVITLSRCLILVSYVVISLWDSISL